MPRTKIICTIGPSTEKVALIRKLIKSGMTVARFNFSHRDHRYHQKLINNVLKAAKLEQKSVALMQDLQGPRIRVGTIPVEAIELKKGEDILIGDIHYFKNDYNKTSENFPNEEKKQRQCLPIDFGEASQKLKPGMRILIDDGLIELEVKNKINELFLSRVIVGGKVISHKNVNILGLTLEKGVLSKKDKQDILFGLKNKIDFIALSFTRSREDLLELQKFIRQNIKKANYSRYYRQNNLKGPGLIAKIERCEAISNLDQIIETADAIMVARGDLGLEMAEEKVPLMQKKIIEQCLLKAKPVIVATQMLDSMIRNPRPTRAEVADVAAAVVDHTDAVMLSGETAFGKYSVESCQMMQKIIKETEASPYDNVSLKVQDDAVLEKDNIERFKKLAKTEESIAKSACSLAYRVKARLILVATLSGNTGRLISKFRPEVPIIVITDSEITARQMLVSWGVKSFIIPHCRTMEKLIKQAMQKVEVEKLAKKGDKIVLIAGEPVGKQGANLLKVQRV